MDRLGPHQALELFGASDTRGEDHCRCLLQKEISVSCSPTTYQPISLKSLTSSPVSGIVRRTPCERSAGGTLGGALPMTSTGSNLKTWTARKRLPVAKKPRFVEVGEESGRKIGLGY